MAKVDWPAADKRALIGKRISRVDGPLKTTGAAKYSYDINRPQMLWAKLVTSPHPKAEVKGVDLSAAEALPGVKAVWKEEETTAVQYCGQIVAAVAAETEEIATEAARLVKVDYQPQEPVIGDSDVELSKERPTNRSTGKVDEVFGGEGVVKVEGKYGCPVITHCCLEPHGQVMEVSGDELLIWPSTQNVSGYTDRLSDSVGIPRDKMKVDCQHMGGGFGSKFGYDKWGTIGALLSKKSGRPVKLMLDRDLELMIAGNRPSAYANIKVAAQRDGTLTGIDAEVWGTGGNGGYNPPPVPYVFTEIPNTRLVGKGIRTNRGGQRAWRAPNHPQGCYLTMSALADMAAALRVDELEFFLKNLQFVKNSERFPNKQQVYADELKIAAEMIGYKQKAHLRGEGGGNGPVKRGLGLSIHTWGGLGHPSQCEVTINPDGSVLTRIGSQDLGVGNRTAIGIVVAETLGLPLEQVTVELGKNSYPQSGASGGSTTIGGVSVSSRKAATEAVNALFQAVAVRMNTDAEKLEAVDGSIRQIDKPSNKISWKQACAALGPNAISKQGACVPGEAEKAKLISQEVCGAQIADVSVDIETGVVTINEFVAVQDVGLIIDLKTAESQVYGAMIMGITYALFEEAVYDNKTGRMLNADMEFYRLAGIKDVGQLKVRMMTGPGYDERGVIGIGEPPVVSPGAAIANAVANACGKRVPYLPLTPEIVLNTLYGGGTVA